MAFDQFGNYIPDAFGGQPVAPPPMNPSMNAAMNPQAAAAANAPPPNMSPVVAPQRPSIAPMGMGGGGGMQAPGSAVGSTAAGLAQGLRNMTDKDGKLGNWQFDKTPLGKAAYGIGDIASSAYDNLAGLFGG